MFIYTNFFKTKICLFIQTILEQKYVYLYKLFQNKKVLKTFVFYLLSFSYIPEYFGGGKTSMTVTYSNEVIIKILIFKIKIISFISIN